MVLEYHDAQFSPPHLLSFFRVFRVFRGFILGLFLEVSAMIRNRIKAHRKVRAGDLVPHEWNFRLHPELPPAQALVDQYLILITCRDEKQQVEMLGRFHQEGLCCKALLS
jgi:hypothetical protein